MSRSLLEFAPAAVLIGTVCGTLALVKLVARAARHQGLAEHWPLPAGLAAQGVLAGSAQKTAGKLMAGSISENSRMDFLRYMLYPVPVSAAVPR